MSETLVAACGWTLLRTVVLCLIGWPIAVAIERWMRNLSTSSQPVALGVMLAPFLFPELLVGYTYRNSALAAPKWAELICSGLLLIRTVPVGVVALLLSPSAVVSSEAIHCRRMWWRTNRWSARGAWQMIRCYIEGPFRRVAPALGLMCLVAFQEFELAALLQTSSWTDWFITAQRVGLERSEMLAQAILPVSIQLPLLIILCFWLTQANGRRWESSAAICPMPAHWIRVQVLAYLVIAFVVGCLVPTFVLGWNLPGGLLLFVRQPTQSSGLGREILVAATVSLCAGSISWLASSFAQPPGGSVLARIVRSPLLIPGLVGSLLLALATVVLFQLSWLRPAYDTPVPWTVAVAVWLLPRAMLLRLWVGMTVQTQETYVSQLLIEQKQFQPGRQNPASDSMSLKEPGRRPSTRSYDLLFRLREQPHWQAVGLLCYWAYLDLSTAYLLAPSSMNSGLVRLYNFMHFGRSAALSAEAFLFFGLPVTAWICIRPILKRVWCFWR
jgi:hypothetical protein